MVSILYTNEQIVKNQICIAKALKYLIHRHGDTLYCVEDMKKILAELDKI